MQNSQEQKPLKVHHAYLILACAAALLAVALYFLSTVQLPAAQNVSGIPEGTRVLMVPPPSPAVVAQLKASRGFQALVSYTNRGFEPQKLVMKKGDTVRWTNNSSGDMWVAAVGSSAHPVYPGTSSCGGSAFDTCKALKPGEFWEFTFDEASTWDYVNNVDKTKTGIVVAQ